MSITFSVFLAFIMGILIVLAPILNGKNAASIGTIQTSFLNYFSAFITALLISSLYTPNISSLSLPPISTLYTGTLIGCVVILLLNWFTVKIKAFYIVVLPFIGQMGMGMFIDYLSSSQFDLKKIVGIALVIVGLLIQQRDKAPQTDKIKPQE